MKILKLLKVELEHIEYYNRMSPFPLYDTEYVGLVKDKIKEMEHSKKEYDDLPVAACKYCKSLHIVADDVENEVCMRCGAVNEVIVFKDIDDYLEHKENDE